MNLFNTFTPSTSASRNYILRAILCLICLYTSSTVHAFSPISKNFLACKKQFLDKTPPLLIDNKYNKKGHNLCFNGFATRYSMQTKTPLWSAEYLTAERLYNAEDLERKDSFHEERRLSIKTRANVDDYKNSGFDRGHLAPNADMANTNQQYDSFSLANIAPQAPSLNRAIWREIESDVRLYTKRYKQAYVVTGVIHPQSSTSRKLNKSIKIPSHFYKAVYLPTVNQAGVYLAPNDDSRRLDLLSLRDFTKNTGIVVFPSLVEHIDNDEILLISDKTDYSDKNQKHKNEADKSKNEQESEKIFWLQLAIGIIAWLIDILSQS